MRKIFKAAIVLAMLLGIFAVAASAQTEPMAGGYSSISVKSKEAKNAAAVAVRSRSAKTGKTITLVKINKAEQQVVAGMNYRVCMTVREGRGKAYTVTAVVYLNLKQKRSLTDWKKGGCSEL